VEHRGVNELTILWRMEHGFVHHPTASAALLLPLAVAFLTTSLVYEQTLTPAARRYWTRLALAARLMEDFACLAGTTVWVSLWGSG